jgi:acyl-coenzyme A thioesterase PaaI-like protein
VVAHNYATASENRIHGDEVARRYGFAGGLVPGVASYAYLTGPALQLLGESWLGAGEISVKLVHPVYDGDAVEATARAAERAGSCELELRDSSGRVCATGSAARAAGEAPPENDPLPFLTPPALEARPAASLEELRPGRLLATLDVDAALRREGRD